MKLWRERLGQIVSLALLMALSTGSWILSSDFNFGSGSASTFVSPDQPVSIVRDAVIRKTNAEGLPHQTIVSKEVTSLRDGRSRLTSPLLHQSRADRPPLRIRADQAEVSADQTLLKLQGNVELERLAYRTEPRVNVRTQQLDYWIKEELARTSDEVQMTRGSAQLTGKGMVVDQRANKVEILAETRMVLPSGDSAGLSMGRKP